MEKISCVVPTYNQSKYLRQSIDSLLNQDIKDVPYEIIIVNDGSTDDTLEILK